jgi:RimJ/RimL family protein N-acetyltransferase
MRRDDERAERKALHGQLDALDADIQTARSDLARATTAHFEEFFQGPHLHKPDSPVEGEPFELRGGSSVRIRPVQPADASRLQQGFHNLSAVSRYRRFLFDRPDVTEEEARDLTQLDHRDHEAIIAVDADDGSGVGIARYVRDQNDPTRAVAAVTIVDPWQGHGLGTELLGRLAARARGVGIEHFEAHIIVGDIEAQRIFEHVGAVETSRRSRGTLDVTVRLAG